MRLIYSFGVKLYGLILLILSPFHPKAKAWIEGRRNGLPEFELEKHSKVVWFHCASLGEFDMALPVMEKFKEKYPDYFLLLTFFSPTGMQHYQKRKNPVDMAIYLPVDTKRNAKKFLKHFQPDLVFFVKYEFWSNFILEAKDAKVRIFSLCTLLRPDHRFFKWYGGFFRRTLKQFDWFFVQNEQSAKLLQSVGIKQYSSIGDTRFDRVLSNRIHAEKNLRIEAFLQGELTMIIGSSWPADEKIIVPYILKHPNKKFILAPHEIDENHIATIEQSLGGRTERYTDQTNDQQVLILNTIGHLSKAYAYGDLAYVGGGFSGKLHNILEPAAFGLPVIFGPKHDRFPEAAQFIDQEIGFSVANTAELEAAIQIIEANHTVLKEKTNAFVEKNKGAASKVVTALEGFKF